MDLVIRGRSRDHRGARPRDTGGPERNQAGQDQRAWEDQSGARQRSSKGRGGRIRGGPTDQQQQQPSSVLQMEPERAGQGSSEAAQSLHHRSGCGSSSPSQPASGRVGEGARVSSSFSFKTKALVCILGRGICNTTGI